MSDVQLHRIPPILLQRSRELRQRQTRAEALLWSKLRNRGLAGYKFRRQHRIGYFIVDFYCAQRKLVVEVDGGYHIWRRDYDQRRTDWLESQDCNVIRFANEQIFDNLEGVLENILRNLSPAEEE